MSGDESEAGDGEESVVGMVAQDASSTATIGSNLLYLSDEQVSLTHLTPSPISHPHPSHTLTHLTPSPISHPHPSHRTPVIMMTLIILTMPRCHSIAMMMMWSSNLPHND